MAKSKWCSGMTLVELMVALVIGSILVAAVCQALVGHERMYQVETQNVKMQQDARAGLEFLVRELRMAGFGVEDDDDPTTNVFMELVNNDTKDSDIDDGTDAITFTAGMGYSSGVAAGAAPGQDQVHVHPACQPWFEFKEDDVVDFLDICLDGQKNLINSTSGSYSIKEVSYGNPATNTPTVLTLTTKLLEALAVGDQVVVQRVAIHYRVRNQVLERLVSTNGGTTWSDPQALIDNVENLQFSYAFDGSDDDELVDINPDDHSTEPNEIIWAVCSGADDMVLDTQVFADGSTDAINAVTFQSDPDDTVDTIGDPSQVPIRAVKVSLLVRSERQFPDPRFRGRSQVLALQDYSPQNPKKDGFRRRLLERKVNFRNLDL